MLSSFQNIRGGPQLTERLYFINGAEHLTNCSSNQVCQTPLLFYSQHYAAVDKSKTALASEDFEEYMSKFFNIYKL